MRATSDAGAPVRISGRPVTVLDAPTNLGLAPPMPGKQPGVSLAPAALRALGLVTALGAADGGSVVPSPYLPDIDADTGIRNLHSIADYTHRLAAAIERQLADGFTPVVLGGDCSVLLGSLLCLRRRGRSGLAFIDGHRDLLTPGTSSTGGAAGMDLALAVGCGPRPLTSPEGHSPLINPADVVLLGDRDDASWSNEECVQAALRQMGHRDLHALRREGVAAAAEWALARWRSQGVMGVWVHLDVDVLDSEEMPAVDSPHPGGLSYEELEALLVPLLQSGLVTGMEITIYDPERDAGDAGARLVSALGGIVSLASRAPHGAV